MASERPDNGNPRLAGAIAPCLPGVIGVVGLGASERRNNGSIKKIFGIINPYRLLIVIKLKAVNCGPPRVTKNSTICETTNPPLRAIGIGFVAFGPSLFEHELWFITDHALHPRHLECGYPVWASVVFLLPRYHHGL